MNKSLDDLRKNIDAADEELLQALAKRIGIVHEIGKLKQQKQIAPLDEKRWQEVMQKITKKAKEHNLPTELIEKIFDEIHKSALSIEKSYE
ncbi:MAG TPA: chorismate mutase [Candidatus Acidoferrales bacterium]|nr:chorismate mutase [Candidatus Acidoferrales bacterium]